MIMAGVLANNGVSLYIAQETKGEVVQGGIVDILVLRPCWPVL